MPFLLEDPYFDDGVSSLILVGPCWLSHWKQVYVSIPWSLDLHMLQCYLEHAENIGLEKKVMKAKALFVVKAHKSIVVWKQYDIAAT